MKRGNSPVIGSVHPDIIAEALMKALPNRAHDPRPANIGPAGQRRCAARALLLPSVLTPQETSFSACCSDTLKRSQPANCFVKTSPSPWSTDLEKERKSNSEEGLGFLNACQALGYASADVFGTTRGECASVLGLLLSSHFRPCETSSSDTPRSRNGSFGQEVPEAVAR